MSSLDLSASIPEAMLVVVLVSFFALIPAAPGYVGTFDAAALFGLSALSIEGGDALGCVLLYRFVIFVPMTVLGLILMLTRYGGLRALARRGARPEPDAPRPAAAATTSSADATCASTARSWPRGRIAPDAGASVSYLRGPVRPAPGGR